jgi:hypothetical protein
MVLIPFLSSLGQTGENCRHRLWGQTGENCPSGFEAKSPANRLSGFEAKLLTNRPSRFEAKPLTNRPPWFWGSIKNSCFSSPCARYRSHTAPPDLSIARPPSTRHVRPSPVLCTRSSTLAMILIAAHHAIPATCTPQDKQTRFSKWNRDKGKTTKMYWIRIQTTASQWLITIKPRNWPLGFSISPLMYLLLIKVQSLKFKFKTPWSTARRPKKPRKTQEGHLV